MDIFEHQFKEEARDNNLTFRHCCTVNELVQLHCIEWDFGEFLNGGPEQIFFTLEVAKNGQIVNPCPFRYRADSRADIPPMGKNLKGTLQNSISGVCNRIDCQTALLICQKVK